MMYTVTCETDRLHIIRRDGVVVGSITSEQQDRESRYPYHYIAVLHELPEQEGRSIRGYQFTETVRRLLGVEYFQYLA